jgi:hypothetical protein
MSPTSERFGSKMVRRLRDWEARTVSRARREHDQAMRDPQIAREHRVQMGRAVSRGEPSCTFCR